MAEYFALDTLAPCLYDLYLSETQVSPLHSLALCTHSCPLSFQSQAAHYSVRGRFAAGISSSLAPAAATGVVSPSSAAGCFASVSIVSVAASVFAVASPSPSAGGVEDAEANKALAASAFASSSSSAATDAASPPLDESTSSSSFLVLVVSSVLLAAELEASGCEFSLGASSAAFDCPSAAPAGLVVAAAAASEALLQSSESSSSLS